MQEQTTTKYPRYAVQQRLYHNPCIVQWDAKAKHYTKSPFKIDECHLRDSVKARDVIIPGDCGYEGIYRFSPEAAKRFTASTGEEVE